MVPPVKVFYRVYKTKEEWNKQARIFILFGLVCGLLIGTVAIFLAFFFAVMW